MALVLPADTRVRVKCTEIPYQYRLSLEVSQGDTLHLQVSVKDTVQIALPGSPIEQLNYSIPRSIDMQSVSNQLELDLTFPRGTQTAFLPQLPVKDLSFIRIDQSIDSKKNTYARQVSTVLSGNLYLEEINGQQYTLRVGERLQFERSNGTLRMLSLDSNQLMLKFHGSVQRMATGWDENLKSLMPT